MNLKSTAILFNQMGKIIVMIFYSMFIFFVWLAQNIGDLSMSFTLILIVFLSSILFFLNKWSINSKKSSNYYFKSNNYQHVNITSVLLNSRCEFRCSRKKMRLSKYNVTCSLICLVILLDCILFIKFNSSNVLQISMGCSCLFFIKIIFNFNTK